MMPLIQVAGRDKFSEGQGEMLMKLFSLFPVVSQGGNEKINSGSLQRYLGEIVWFPSAALSPYITWGMIDDRSAKATMTYQGNTGSGVFTFDEKGHFQRFSARRYRGGEEDAERREWIIIAKESEVRNNIRIPVKLEATWKLESGDWTWLKIEITHIEYNRPERFK